jgi:hypothetical protein
MAITNATLDELSESDLSEMVTDGVSESLHIDFKEESYGNSDSDKRELLKDVSAFANANGGHIVIGVKEVAGVASELIGIRPSDIDAEVLRLEQIIRTGIEPRVPGCRLRSIRLKSGANAIVVRIGRSWRLPHRVSAQNSNRFWIRNSGGCHEASMDELRSLFGQNTAAVDYARRFRDERVALIQRGTGPRPLVGNGRLVFHVVPHSAVLTANAPDIEQIYKHHQAFWPLGSMSNSSRFNFEGVINERGGDANHGYTQIFRNGIVEATKANIVRVTNGGRGIPGLGLEKHFFERYASYIDGLKAIGIDPPLIVMLTLEGVSGAYYHVKNDMFMDDPMAFDRDVLYLPDCMISEYGPPESYHAAIRPAFDALWNAVGFSRSQFFNQAGLWVGSQR